MPSFVYILGAVSGARALTYVGGIGARSTRGRQWMLLYSESCNGKRHAMSREWHLKRDRSLRRRLLQTLSAPALTAR
jgi:putative endonuclease